MSGEAVALALSGRAVLICGVRRHANGGLRVYVGGRRYFIAHPDTEDAVQRAWDGAAMGHLVMERSHLDGVPIFTEEAS